ncbi:Protein of unknown function [Gryllus bimaculatus]|nr:Protein of unknown function [Gryllus bimaculatus]
MARLAPTYMSACSMFLFPNQVSFPSRAPSQTSKLLLTLSWLPVMCGSVGEDRTRKREERSLARLAWGLRLLPCRRCGRGSARPLADLAHHVAALQLALARRPHLRLRNTAQHHTRWRGRGRGQGRQ